MISHLQMSLVQAEVTFNKCKSTWTILYKHIFIWLYRYWCHNRGHSGVCLSWWGNSFTCSCSYPYSISSSRPSVPSQWVRPEHGVVSPGKGHVSVFCRWHCHGISGGGRTQTGAHHCLPLHWRSEAFPEFFFFFFHLLFGSPYFLQHFSIHFTLPFFFSYFNHSQFSSVFAHRHWFSLFLSFSLLNVHSLTFSYHLIFSFFNH